jgi:TldD protein
MDKKTYGISKELASTVISKALSKGFEYADIFVEHKPHLSIRLEDDKIEKVVSGVDSGIGIRVIRGNKTAYAYSNDFSEKSLIEQAETVCRAAETAGSVSVNLKKTTPEIDFMIEMKPNEVGIDRKIALLMNADRIARKVSRKIKQVTVSYSDSIQNVYVASSHGTISEDERIYSLGLIQVVASEGDILQTGYEPLGGFIGFELFNRESFDEIAQKVALKAVALLDARKVPGGRMPVVISSEAGGTMIHEAIGHGLEADLAQQGLSVYSGKIGQKVASPIITVIDDSTLQGKRGSFRCDDEGVVSQKTILVENGILKGYLYDTLTALKDNVSSTGNGRRESYESRPIPRMSNTFIAQGESNPRDIIRSIDKGLFVRKMGGGQVNTVTGEFVFEVSEGYMIEKGQVSEMVRGATLIGSGPEVLNTIDKVGDDLGFSIGTCGKDSQGVPVSDAMPTVRIPEIVVGGRA